MQCVPHIHKSQLLKWTWEQLDAVHTLLTSDPFWPLRPVFACVNACRKTPLTIHFIYLGNKEIYWIFKGMLYNAIICFTFNKTPFISYFIFFCWKNMIFRNHAANLNTCPSILLLYTPRIMFHITVGPKNLH